MDTMLTALLAHGPVARRDHRPLARQLDRALASGRVVAPFRGVYHLPGADHGVRAAALLLADPRAVLTHESAAHVHGWCPAPDAVRAASTLLPRPGYELARRRIPPALVARSGGVRRTSRALTTLDLAREQGSDAIDDALRRRVPLEALAEALTLTPQVAGNERLRVLLGESRSRPWSRAERAGHEALHGAGVRGWVANLAVSVSRERTFHVDVGFRAIRLAIEIDGWKHHQGLGPFRADRLRDVALARRGWHVVRFPASWVLRHGAAFADAVAEIAAKRQALFGR